MAKRTETNYEPIPGVEDGYTALTIYSPGNGNWPGALDWKVFVGGCGVGGRHTLKAAKQFLLEQAIAYCDRQIAKAQRTIEHYTAQKNRLLHDGLTLDHPKQLG